MADRTPIRQRKTHGLRLSKLELIHLRDLFSVTLATDAKQTVSQALAVAEDRSIIETKLWQRIVEACNLAHVSLGDDAPDFVCAAMVPPPPVGVFRIASEPPEESTDESGPFDSEDSK